MTLTFGQLSASQQQAYIARFYKTTESRETWGSIYPLGWIDAITKLMDEFAYVENERIRPPGNANRNTLPSIRQQKVLGALSGTPQHVTTIAKELSITTFSAAATLGMLRRTGRATCITDGNHKLWKRA